MLQQIGLAGRVHMVAEGAEVAEVAEVAEGAVSAPQAQVLEQPPEPRLRSRGSLEELDRLLAHALLAHAERAGSRGIGAIRGIRIQDARGQLIEIGGAPSSGRTALAQRMSAQVTARGELVGWVDTANALDPRSLARAGANVQRVLWVRSDQFKQALRAVELLQKAGFALVVLDLGGIEPRLLQRLGQAPWARFQRMARTRGASVLVLSRDLHPLGQCWSGACAALGLVLQKQRACFDAGLFEGFETRARVVRQRGGGDGDAFALQLRQRLQKH